MSEKLRVVLVDDQSLCRRGLSELLANCYDFDVLGATDNIEELRVICLTKPDLLVVDLRMKPMDGISLITQLRNEGLTFPVVMLTMSDSETDLANAIRAGVRGYLLKDMAPEDVVDSIRRVAAGELVVAPAMTVKMIDLLRGAQPGQEPRNSPARRMHPRARRCRSGACAPSSCRSCPRCRASRGCSGSA